MEASNNNVVAPFVMKTYQMVSDPMTDALISWGPANNTFIVADPLDFSQRILPAYFKHSNFSSFVRQLNTYGFRKVDPDRWEFANECFLRGQRQLLNNIVRKKHGRSNYPVAHRRGEGDDEAIVTEIARLKQEQRSLEEELEGMSKRLEATERRPQQMMAFLYKVAEDPQLLPRLLLEKERAKALTQKKRRLITSSPSGAAVTNSVKSEEEDVEVEEGTAMGVISSFSSPETNFDGDTFRPSPDTPSAAWLSRRQASGQPLIDQEAGDCTAVPRLAPAASAAAKSGLSTASPAMMGCDSNGDGRSYLEGLGAVMDGSPPPYPFSLLGGGF